LKTKISRIAVLLIVFVIVFLIHLLYFRFVKQNCGSAPWFQKYVGKQEYFIGVSYALSFAFMMYAFLKYKEKRKAALQAAAGSGFMAMVLWLSCFLLGCCGSPMAGIYLNWFGLSSLNLPNMALFIITCVFVGLSYLWLIRKSPCCTGDPCCSDKENLS
jgi:hypothetical protein